MCNSRNVANTTASVPMLAAKHNPGSCQAQLAPHMGCSAPAGTPPPASQGGDDTTNLTLFTRGNLYDLCRHIKVRDDAGSLFKAHHGMIVSCDAKARQKIYMHSTESSMMTW